MKTIHLSLAIIWLLILMSLIHHVDLEKKDLHTTDYVRLFNILINTVLFSYNFSCFIELIIKKRNENT